MKVEEKTQRVINSPDIVSQAFKVSLTPQAFEILSAGVYSDKIGAIIRELSTNAVDSQKAAGVNIPFDIHLPNHFDPNFRIRDYGTGLCDEDVLDIYTTYFRSNKTDSNDFTGCLGLGSKSPFAYTNQFTVTSYFNGQRTIFTAFLNSQKIPSVSKRYSEETPERNGLCIEFAAKSEDFYSFESKASFYLSWFENRPCVTGSSKFQFLDHSYIIETPQWGINGKNSGSHAIMGNVAYPIDYYKLSSEDKKSSYKQYDDIYYTILQLGIDLFFDIGEVDFAASREALGYTPKTIKALTTKLDHVKATLVSEINKLIKNEKDLWHARLKLSTCFNNSIFSILKGQKFVIEYNGVDLMVEYPLDKSMVITHCSKDSSTISGVSRTRVYSFSPGRYAQKDIVFYHGDMTTGNFSAVSRAITKDQTAVVIQNLDDKFVEHMGLGSYLNKASSISKLPVVKRGPIDFKLARFKKSSYNDEVWKLVDLDIATPGVYVELDKNLTKGLADTPISANSMQDIMKFVKEAFDPNLQIYGATKTKIPKLKHWTTLKDYILGKIGSIQTYDEWNHKRNKWGYGELDHEYCKVEYYHVDSPFRKFLETSAELDKFCTTKNKSIINLLLRLGWIKHPTEKKTYFEELTEHYPMFDFIDIFAMKTYQYSIIKDYVNLMDKRAGLHI